MICNYIKVYWRSSYKFYRLVSFKLKDNCSSTLLGVQAKASKSVYHRETTCLCFFMASYHNSQVTESTFVTINRWMTWRMWLCIHDRALLRQKAKLCHFLGNGNELESIILSKIIQIQNDKYHKFLSYVEPVFYVYKHCVYMYTCMTWSKEGTVWEEEWDSLEWGQQSHVQWIWPSFIKYLNKIVNL